MTARSIGHHAIGFDTDPLAVLIAKTGCSDVAAERILKQAEKILNRAKARARSLSHGLAYPDDADDETKAFIRFWFDVTTRRQLAALSREIAELPTANERDLFWTALSRLIITKKHGVSLAIDVSHSRPHRAYKKAPVTPFEQFPIAVKSILRVAPFQDTDAGLPKARAELGDARRIPLGDKTVGMVITSPPYLNAIDYLRGHKLSLVWMGHSIASLRAIRADNVGSENSSTCKKETKDQTAKIVASMGRVDRLSNAVRNMLSKYVWDLNSVVREISRVLVIDGRAVFVVGDSTLQGVFIENSRAVRNLAKQNGLALDDVTKRPLPENRRYLPPPTSAKTGKQLRKRMSEEVILTFRKHAHKIASPQSHAIGA